MFYPARGRRSEPTWFDQILLWLPGAGWFYYLWFGYRPRAVNHYNLVGASLRKAIKHNCLFSSLFQFEPLFYGKHVLGVGLSLGTYVGMVGNSRWNLSDVYLLFPVLRNVSVRPFLWSGQFSGLSIDSSVHLRLLHRHHHHAAPHRSVSDSCDEFLCWTSLLCF